MKKALSLMLVLVMLLGLLTACGKKTGAGDGEQVTGGVKGYPKVTITGDKVVVCSNAATRDRYKDLLKEVYGLDVEDIVVPYNDYTTGYATRILSGESPDVGFYRIDQADFPRYIVNDLVDDVNQYVDLSDEFYDPIRNLLTATTYQGGNYLMPYNVGTSQAVFYNTKLFTDLELETPWDLYLKDEWTLDKLEEYARELTVIDQGGKPTRYGFALNRPFGMYYTTGQAMGSFDAETGAVINNMKNPDFARVMGMLSRWVKEYKCTPPRLEETLGWLDDDQVGMVFSQGFFTDEAVVALAQDGNLGIAPMARDKQCDGYYARGACSSWWLTKGASNPGGAIAFWNVYVKDVAEGGHLQETYATCEKNGFSEENMEQVKTVLDPTKVKPVLELCPWMAGGADWYMILRSSTWDVELEKTSGNVQAQMESLFKPLEEDLPISPKPIDQYKSADDLKKYVVVSEGGQNIKLTLNEANAPGGEGYALQYAYDVSDKGWGGVSIDYGKTWENNNGLRFWIKGDGSTQIVKFSVSFITGASFVYEYKLEGDEGKIVSVPFADFSESDDSASDEWMLEKVGKIGIYVEGKGKHTFWLDNFEAYNTEK